MDHLLDGITDEFSQGHEVYAAPGDSARASLIRRPDTRIAIASYDKSTAAR
ncbi:hypothetical protein [Streptomyces xylophagus]|uniref:hypothetical protein n=1 Tax=Streptomyces xylophagus TaxID=285514 RepID=UPI000A7B681A|nr:hypothetical protein [Streptomyces xylophagus]